MQPSRGLISVRPIETDEALPGGRIVLVAETRERMTAWQCECVAVGLAALCEDEDCERQHVEQWPTEYRTELVHPCPVRIGDWLLVRPRSYVAGPEPERTEWFVHQDDVLAILSEE